MQIVTTEPETASWVLTNGRFVCSHDAGIETEMVTLDYMSFSGPEQKEIPNYFCVDPDCQANLTDMLGSDWNEPDFDRDEG